MGRPSNFEKNLVERIQERHGLEIGHQADALRSCPYAQFNSAAGRLVCSDCATGNCQRLAEVGLDDDGAPLPKKDRPHCGARTRAGGNCRARIVPGKRRCRIHGGLSSGPKTPEGRALIARAQRSRWAKHKLSKHRVVDMKPNEAISEDSED